jgi:hypothetical protein
MKRSILVATSLVLVASACYIEDPARTNGANAQPTGTAQPTATVAPQPTATTAQPTATVAPQPTATSAPQPTATVPTTFPTMAGPVPTAPAPGTKPALPPGLAIPGVCVPIGSWTKQFDNGLPASGTVEIGTPIMFNQFPVTDGVVVVSAPVGTLKGTGAMTSTNDLSIDVTNGAIVASYTCKFSGATCNQGVCTMTKGGVGGFKLVKR